VVYFQVQKSSEAVIGDGETRTVRPYQFDLLIHEYGDSVFRKRDL